MVDDYYANLDRIFSSASIIYDEKILSNFINVNIRNMELSTLIKFSRNRNSILEIGCGTGQEASRFILSTNKNVTCIDAASGMIEYATSKMKSLGIAERFRGVKLPAYRIQELNMHFDLVYSFNGALNTEPNLESFASSLEEVVPRGGVVIISLRNRVCLGESLLYSLLGRKSPVKSRLSRTTPVQVVGNSVESFYYSPNEIREFFSAFALKRKIGLGILVPPYLADRFPGQLLKEILNASERLISGIPFFSSLGDEVLYVFEKK